MYLESVWGRAMVKGCGKDGEGRGEIGRVKVGGGGGGGGTAEDEGSGGVHCGFIPANTFIMADLAEPVTHCRGYISASIPTTTPPSLPPLPARPLIPISTQSPRRYIPYSDKTSLFQWLADSFPRYYRHQPGKRRTIDAARRLWAHTLPSGVIVALHMP